ncbi:CHAT domain-containing protein [Tenacibaculum xiamenense]|uniref:CHAT domain-containing protein n=1 Tax=Tenacibaculum xiamenense TaxID=1261553 RepID=UPI003894272E
MRIITILRLVFFLTCCAIYSQKSDFELGKHELFYGNIKDAIVNLEKALENSQENNSICEAAIYNELSKAYRLTYQLDKAESFANKALNSKCEEHEKAKAYDNIALVHFIKRDFERALKLHETALIIRERIEPKDKLGQAISLYNIGNVLVEKTDYEKALDYLNKGLEIQVEKTPEYNVLVADIHSAISTVYYDQGKFSEAIEYVEKVISIASEVFEGDNLYFSSAYNMLGVLFSMKEELNKSLNYYKKALVVNVKYHDEDSNINQAMIHYNIGTIYRKQGVKEKALYHTHKTLNIGIKFLGENHENLAFPYSQLGQIYGKEKGIQYLQKALNIYENSPYKNSVRISYQHEYLADAYFNIKDYHQALNHSEKTLEYRVKEFGYYNRHSIGALNIISKVYIQLGNYNKALSNITDAINYNSSKQISDDLILESLKIKGDISLKIYEETEDQSYLQESASLYQRASLLIDYSKRRNFEDKIAFSETVKGIYEGGIETNLLLYEIKKENVFLEKAFYLSEKSKANILKEFVLESRVRTSSKSNSKIVDLEKSIDREITKLSSTIVKEANSTGKDTLGIYKLEGEILSLVRKKEALEKQIEESIPELEKLKEIKISQIQENMDNDLTILNFFSSKKSLYAFILTKSELHLKKLGLLNENLLKDLDIAIKNKNRGVFREKSYELYTELIKPVEHRFIGDKLIIVPDELLWNVPFDLLLTEKVVEKEKLPYLLFKYAVSYSNAISLTFNKNIKSKLLKEECLAFSFSNSEDSLSTVRKSTNTDLPGTRKELHEIAEVFDGAYFYNGNSNESNFKENADKYKLIHLALHGEVDHVNPKNSRVLFTNALNDTIEDNVLYSHELYTMNISADLVVLSACDTGSGVVNKSEGILSLGYAFQHAGAKSLLLSRWRISDKTTPKIMKLFYENLEGGMNKSVALQKAKIKFLEETDVFTRSPFYWGSFYVVGDTEPISLKRNSLKNIWIYVFVFLGIIGIVYTMKKRKH